MYLWNGLYVVYRNNLGLPNIPLNNECDQHMAALCEKYGRVFVSFPCKCNIKYETETTYCVGFGFCFSPPKNIVPLL